MEDRSRSMSLPTRRAVNEPEIEPEREPVFKVANKCQAFLLLLVGCLMFTLHVVTMAEKSSWVKIRTGLRMVSGNLPTGSDQFTGTYPSVEVCHAIAEDASDVSGFVWVPVQGSPNDVHCEFKTVGTPLESGTVDNRTAVIKGAAGASCGLFECSKTPFSNTIDFYDCEMLMDTIRTFQGFSVMAAIMLGGHLILQFLLWINSWGKQLGPLLELLPYSYALQAVFYVITWASLVAAYAFKFCGRRIRTVSSLNYGLYFLIGNTVLCYTCYVLTRSAFKYAIPNRIVRPELQLRKPNKRRSTVAATRSINSANL